jgi:hypothetical protein
MRGRLASLLEVETISPRTDREGKYIPQRCDFGNVKTEIKKKHFDAIVDFTGIERFL